MTNPITDPEEHLREAAFNYVRGPTSGTFGARDELYAAAEAYAESVGRSSTPEAAAELLPCPFCGVHPERHVRDDGVVWFRHPHSEAGGCGLGIGPGVTFLADYAHIWNTRHSPCLPDTRPSDTAKWTCAALKQSLPEPADCDWPFCGCDEHASKVMSALEECGALKDRSEVAEQVHPTDTRIQPTDEAIRSFMASNWGVDDEEAIYLVNAALAHFSPTQTVTPVEPEITDDSIWQTFCATNPNTMVGWDRIVQFGRKLIKMARP